MFKYTYETRYSDYKDYDTVKPGVILDMIQDVSIKDSASKGYGLCELNKMNLAWMIRGINVKFERPVKTMLPIEASTGVKSLKGISSERGCIIKQNGEVVAKSVASWFLFDTEKFKMTRVLPEMISAYEIYDFKDDFFSYSALKTMTIDEVKYTVRVGNKEIDTNRHMNNQRAADLLMDALPFDFCFNDINLVFKKQAMLGKELGICIAEKENGYYVHLQTSDNEVCVAGEFCNV